MKENTYTPLFPRVDSEWEEDFVKFFFEAMEASDKAKYGDDKIVIRDYQYLGITSAFKHYIRDLLQQYVVKEHKRTVKLTYDILDDKRRTKKALEKLNNNK